MKARTQVQKKKTKKKSVRKAVAAKPVIVGKYPVYFSPHATTMPTGDAFTAIQIVQALAADRLAVQKERRCGTEPVYAEHVCNGKRWMSLDTVLNPIRPSSDLCSDVRALSKISGVKGFFVVRAAKVLLFFKKLFKRRKNEVPKA